MKILEAEFLQVTEESIEKIFKKVLFERHRESIIRVSECFTIHKQDLSAAQECSEKAQ